MKRNKNSPYDSFESHEAFLSDLEQDAKSASIISMDQRIGYLINEKPKHDVKGEFLISSCEYDYRILMTVDDRQWHIYVRKKYAYAIAIERYRKIEKNTLDYDHLIIFKDNLTRMKDIFYIVEDALGQSLPTELWDVLDDK